MRAPSGWRLASYPVETGLLLGLCFALPLLEAPKTILWLAYAFAWVVNRVRARDFGGPWSGWDNLIALWIASGFVVAGFAGLHGGEWGDAGDLVRYASVVWMVRRARYPSREMRWVLGMLVTSTVIGLVVGHARLVRDPSGTALLELHSVGHINHTAIYLAIMLGVCAAWIFARWRSWRLGSRAVGVAVITLVLVSLVMTASRAAVGVGLALLPMLAAAWWRRSRIPLAISAAVVLAVLIAAVVGGASVVRKHWDIADKHNVLNYRDGVWRVAIATWERHPWFGVGMGNYGRVDLEHLRTWDEDAGRPHDPGKYHLASHGHSIYANALAERGLVGSAVLLAVLAAWGYSVMRYRPQRADPDEHWLVWGCATSAWLVTAVAGLVNTTLHHEHGLLAALVLGLWLSRRAGAPQALIGEARREHLER